MSALEPYTTGESPEQILLLMLWNVVDHTLRVLLAVESTTDRTAVLGLLLKFEEALEPLVRRLDADDDVPF